MLDQVYEWLQNMVFFLLLAGAVLDALPGNNYRKYVRFFAGMIVVLLLVSPLLKLGNLADVFDERYHERELEWMAQEKEQMEAYFEQAATADEILGQYLEETENSGGIENADGIENAGGTENADRNKTAGGEEKIEVEEIRIGE